MKGNNEHISKLPADGNENLPLYNFFIYLKQNNFSVTPIQIADANRIISKYSNEVKNELELCNYLAPVFANSEEEQIQFRQIFEEFLVTGQTQDVLKAHLPEQNKKAPEKRKKIKWKVIIGLIIIAAVTWIAIDLSSDPPKPGPKPEFILVTNFYEPDSIELTNAANPQNYKGIAAEILVDSTTINQANSITVKQSINWGDNTPVDTFAVDTIPFGTLPKHIYLSEGIYNLIATAEVYFNEVYKQTDTLESTVGICFDPATVTIEKSFSGDSIAKGQRFSLIATISGKKPDSVAWTGSRSDIDVSSNKAGKDFVLNMEASVEGSQSIFCTAFYGGINAPCNVQGISDFYVYDPAPKPHVIFYPSANAKPITLRNKVHDYWFYLMGSLALLSFISLVFFAIRWNRIKKKKGNTAKDNQDQYDEMVGSFSSKAGSEEIPFHNKNFLPLPEPEMRDVARLMRRRISDEATYMHVEKTISKAIRNSGFFDPVNATRTQQGEFLVLIDERNPNDQQLKLFDFLLELLKKQNVLIDKYYYKKSPLLCRHEKEDHEISLEKLSEKYPGHILLIFGNAYQLIYDDYPAFDQSGMILLNRWQYKAIMTPVSFSDWGNKEKKILLQHLPVFPVDIPGLLLLMQKLFGEEVNILAELYEASDAFYEADMVDFEDMDELLDYCSKAGWANIPTGDKYSNILFQWTAALAIYPKIRWEITLAIGKDLLEKYGQPQELNFTTLLRLARISWIGLGKFPDYTRLELLKHLSTENEVVARETILKMLNEIPETELNNSHFAFEEKETQRLINEFSLYAYDPVDKYAHYAHAKELFAKFNNNGLVTDVPAKTYFENPGLEWKTLINKPAPKDKLNEKQPNISLKDYLDDGRGKRSLTEKIYLFATLLSTLLIVVSILGLIMLGIFQISGSIRFSPFTYLEVKERQIQINCSDLNGLKPESLTLSIDTVTADLLSNIKNSEELISLDSATTSIDTTLLVSKLDTPEPTLGTPGQLLTFDSIQMNVTVDENYKPVNLTWNNITLFDSTMIVRHDSYDLKLTYEKQDAPSLSANIIVPPGCKAGMNIYKSIITKVDSKIQVIETPAAVSLSDDVDDGDSRNNRCLDRITYGTDVDKNKVDAIIKGFLSYALDLKKDLQQKYYVAGRNQIIVYRSADSVLTSPQVFIQVSDRSLMTSANKFKQELERNKYKVVPVELQNAIKKTDILFYNSNLQFAANDINKLYTRYYPDMNVKAQQVPGNIYTANNNRILVRIRKKDDGLNLAVVHYQSPDGSITGDFYINQKTNQWEEFNNDPLNKGQSKQMNLISRSADQIILSSPAEGANIRIDLKQKTIIVAGIKSYKILSVSDKMLDKLPVYPIKENTALNFFKGGSYVQMKDFNLGISDFTLEAWIKHTGNTRSYIISNRTNEFGSNGNWFSLVFAENNSIEFEMGSDNFKAGAICKGKTSLANYKWYHIAVTRKKNIITLYVNGYIDGNLSDVEDRNLTSENNIARLGGWPENTSGAADFLGSIDEVRIWKVAKTESQVLVNMLKGIPVNSPGLQSYYKFDEGAGNPAADKAGRNNGSIRGGFDLMNAMIPAFVEK